MGVHGELLTTPPSVARIARGSVLASGIGRNQLRGKPAHGLVFKTEIVIRHPHFTAGIQGRDTIHFFIDTDSSLARRDLAAANISSISPMKMSICSSSLF